MKDIDPRNVESAIEQVRHFAEVENIRLTPHAHQEMIEEEISLNEVLQALINGRMIENYPEHQRGACCLVYGDTQINRPLHVVCTTTKPILIIITVYEPKLPKWLNPTQRRQV